MKVVLLSLALLVTACATPSRSAFDAQFWIEREERMSKW